MANYYLCPFASILQYFSNTGVALSGGKVYTYLAGTTTPTATWTSNTGSVQNGNPITLDSAGRLPNVSIWQLGGFAIKIIIKDANGNQLGPTFDQVSGINDPVEISTSLANPASGHGVDLVANAMKSYDLFTSLRAVDPPTLAAGQTLVVDVQAATTPGDGLGGLFYWDATSTATDDGANVIKPTGFSSAGRYLRQNMNTSGSFTATVTGCTTTVTGTMKWVKPSPSVVFLYQDVNITGTSNSTAMTVTGLPTAITPTSDRTTPVIVVDNNAGKGGWAVIKNTGTVLFNTGFDGSGSFTAAGVKGLGASGIMVYNI